MPQNSTQTLDQKAAERAKIAIRKSLLELNPLDRKFGNIMISNRLAKGLFSLLDVLLDPIAIIIASISAILAYAVLVSLNIILSSTINTMAAILVFKATWAATLLLRGLYQLLFKR